MRRILFVILNVLVGGLWAFSQSGEWSGDLEVRGVKLPLVFHLDDDNPTIDSPAQGAKGIPARLSRLAPDSIIINIPAIGASFSGRCKGEELIGTFSQGGMALPLTLTKGKAELLRPQTPVPPFPYTQQEVSFANGDALLKGTLTLPADYGRETPVVIMITGSGLQNRDEEIYGHKPFAVLADALARNGIASLRYDDRGFGESTGDAVNSTIEDLKNDALSGVDLLRQRFDRVGALGHSEGGTISLMLGAEDKVDFIVSLAAMVVSGKETLLDQNRYLLSDAGFEQGVVEEYCTLLAGAFGGDGTVSSRIETSGLPAELKRNLQAALMQLNTPYIRYFLGLDVRDRLGLIRCPVLALNGTKDTQVSCENNLDVLRKGLPSVSENQILPLEDLNHLMQHSITGSPNEYSTITETISPSLLTLIPEWINGIR